MTEKRYKLSEPNGAYLIDNDRPYAHWINDDDKIIDLLNALHEENVKLQARNKYLATKIQRERNSYQKQHEKWENEIQKENEQLKQDKTNLHRAMSKDRVRYLNENEQLKQQMQRLYNYFADWFNDRVPPSDFSEMWDFVKEDKKWD